MRSRGRGVELVVDAERWRRWRVLRRRRRRRGVGIGREGGTGEVASDRFGRAQGLAGAAGDGELCGRGGLSQILGAREVEERVRAARGHM